MKAPSLLFGLCLGLCAATDVQAEQCVPFARQISGVSLTGDALRWWAAADDRYERGSAPKVGAVLVFKPTTQMRLGHVAVVRRIVSRREIRIDHANWAATNQGRISLDAPVIDVSAANDWSQVRVWYEPAGSFGGRVNPVHGFIYAADRQIPPQSASKGLSRPAPQAPRLVEAAVVVKAAVVVETTVGPPSAVQLNAAVLARLRGVSSEDILNAVGGAGARPTAPPA